LAIVDNFLGFRTETGFLDVKNRFFLQVFQNETGEARQQATKKTTVKTVAVFVLLTLTHDTIMR
jgi:hypothetical protein